MKTLQETTVQDLQDHIHYRFGQVKLLVQALTHSSYANERSVGGSNERLEFLGDAVLDLFISLELYASFPSADEGQLTRLRARLVSEPTLAGIARAIGLNHFLLLGRGEEAQGGRERDALLADGLEALIAAVYLDGGFEAGRSLIRLLYREIWPTGAEVPVFKDYKTRLQELTQKLFQDRPVYTLIESAGPEHAKIYRVQVDIQGQSVAAEASSVKKAEQMAARKALALIAPGEEEAAP
jgi:ribonuclease III